MSAEVVNRSIIVNIVADDVEAAQEKLLKKQKALNDEIKRTNDPKALKDLNAQLKATEQQLDRNSKVLKGELLPTYNQLTAAVRKYYAEWKKTGDPAVLQKYAEANALLKQQKAEINSLEKAAGTIGKQGFFQASFWGNLAANGIAIASRYLSDFLIGSVEESINAEEAVSRLEGTLSNLGRTDAFDRLIKKADEMAKKFKYLDNDDIIGVFESLITYGKLTEKEINNLLPVIIDFSAKSRISLDEASSVVIKALEGNGKALKEYGIDIKDTGTETERLNIIMTVLKQKVEGAASAFSTTAKGAIAEARQEFADIKEEIGNGLITVLNTWYKNLRSFFSALRTELKGGSGFIQIAIDEVNDNPELKKAVIESSKQTVNSVLAAQKQIEQQLGRQLNLKNKSDAELLKNNQNLRIKGIEDAIKSDSERLNKLLESGRRNDQLEARSLKISITARQQAVNELNTILSEDDGKVLGLGGSGGKKDKKDPVDKIKKLKTAWDELKDVQESSYKAVKAYARDQEKIFADADKFIKANLAALAPEGIDPAQRINQFDRNRVAGMELKVQTSRGKERLAAEFDLLKELERQELDNKELTENEKLKIEDDYRKRRQEAESNYWLGLINTIADYANSALNILDTFAQARNTKEDKELERDRRLNDKKEKNLSSRLRKGLISQAEYDRQLADLNEKQDKRERQVQLQQFKRNQSIAIAQAVVNAAQGITSTYAARPGLADIVGLGVARGIQVALIAGSLLAQIKAIRNSKPEFARGGILGGRLHSEGGNAIVDGHGRKIAEIERGEGIINRHSMADRRSYTFTGTPSQIASTINRMGGGIAWDTSAYTGKYMNYSAINKRYYATGGVFDSQAAADAGANGKEILVAINQLNGILSRGIKAYTLLTEFETQQDRLNAIRADATMG